MPMSAGTLTELMRSAGIVQESDPALLEVARDLVLPDEADEALGVVEALEAAAERVAAVHVFAKGWASLPRRLGSEGPLPSSVFRRAGPLRCSIR